MSFPGWSIGKPQIGGNPFDRIMPPPVPGAPAPAAPAAPAVPAGAPPAVPAGSPLPAQGQLDLSQPPTPPDPNQFAPPPPPGRESVYEGPSGEMPPPPDMPDSGNLMYWQQLANTPIGTATQADPHGPMFRNLQRNVASFMAQRDAKKMQEAQARFDAWEMQRNQARSGEIARVLEAGGSYADIAKIEADYGASPETEAAIETMREQDADRMEVWVETTRFRKEAMAEQYAITRSHTTGHTARMDREVDAANGIVDAVMTAGAMDGNPGAQRALSAGSQWAGAMTGGPPGSTTFGTALDDVSGQLAGVGAQQVQPVPAALVNAMKNGEVSFLASVNGQEVGPPVRGADIAFFTPGGDLSDDEKTAIDDYYGSMALAKGMAIAGSVTPESLRMVGSPAARLTPESAHVLSIAINTLIRQTGSDERISGPDLQGPAPTGPPAAGAAGGGGHPAGDSDYWVNVAGVHPDWIEGIESGQVNAHVLMQAYLEAGETGEPAFYMVPKTNSRQLGPGPRGPRPVAEVIGEISKTPEEILKIRERVETLGLTEKQIKAKYDELVGKGALDRQEQGELTELHIWLKEAGIIE